MALNRQDELDGLADGRAAVDARQDNLRRQQQAGAFEVGGREVALALGQALDELGVHEQPHFPDDRVGGVAVGVGRLDVEVGGRFRHEPVAGLLHRALGAGGHGDDDAARLVGLHEADVRGGPAAQFVDQARCCR